MILPGFKAITFSTMVGLLIRNLLRLVLVNTFKARAEDKLSDIIREMRLYKKDLMIVNDIMLTQPCR